MALTGSKAKILLGNTCSDEFDINTGVRQGDSLSVVLFNLTLHQAIGAMQSKGHIISKSKQACVGDYNLKVLNNSSILEQALTALT